MTRRTNARIAGFTFLFYIAVAFPSMVIFNRATNGEGMAAKLAGIAQHANDVRLSVVLSLAGCFSALVLAVTLYAITRDEDPDLAMLGLTCRVGEGLAGAVSIPATLGLLQLATATGPQSPDGAATQALAAFVLEQTPLVPAIFFAVGSTCFSWLLLRGRMIRRVGLARGRGVDPRRGVPAPAARRSAPRPDHPAHMASDGGVRDSARTVAAHQGRRCRPIALITSQHLEKAPGQGVGRLPETV